MGCAFTWGGLKRLYGLGAIIGGLGADALFGGGGEIG